MFPLLKGLFTSLSRHSSFPMSLHPKSPCFMSPCLTSPRKTGRGSDASGDTWDTGMVDGVSILTESFSHHAPAVGHTPHDTYMWPTPYTASMLTHAPWHTLLSAPQLYPCCPDTCQLMTTCLAHQQPQVGHQSSLSDAEYASPSLDWVWTGTRLI